MRSSLLLFLCPLAVYSLDKVVVDFDKSLEGRVGTFEQVEEVAGRFSNKAQPRKPKRSLDEADIGVGSLFARTPHISSHASLQERYLTCDPGYGLCQNFAGCCPSDNKCCSYGYCLEPNYKCCPTGPCAPDQGCCGSSHCFPVNGECCADETSCTPGNHCYKHPKYSGSVCCTDSKCTASVDDHGSTTFASTSTTTRTLTTTRTQAYYWTITYWYWYYYWTVSVNIHASIVTSSRSTATTVFSVETTDANAASSYFEDLSKTLTLPTPAEATSLESLAGKTSFEDTPTQTQSPKPDSTSDTTSEEPSSESTSSSSASSSSAETLSDEPSTTASSAQDSTAVVDTSSSATGVSSGSARALWSSVDPFTLGFLTVGLGIGVVAVLL